MDTYEKKIREYLNNGEVDELYKNMLLNLFPELKESEDERIRKGLIKAVSRTFEGNKLYGTDVTREEALAWLEKKGRQKPVVIIPKFRIGDNIKNTNEEPLTITKIDDKGYWSEDLLVCDFDDAAKWELVEQKPADKIEQKFKVGDWIVNKGHSYLIADIDYEQRRYLFEIGGYTHEQLNWEYIENADNKYHLWTIQDSKGGDVLVDVYGNIGIFEQCDDFDWVSYCSLGHNGGFQHFKIEHENEKTYPATKEWRDQLKKAMFDAGYKWNKEELKLEKI